MNKSRMISKHCKHFLALASKPRKSWWMFSMMRRLWRWTRTFIAFPIVLDLWQPKHRSKPTKNWKKFCQKKSRKKSIIQWYFLEDITARLKNQNVKIVKFASNVIIENPHFKKILIWDFFIRHQSQCASLFRVREFPQYRYVWVQRAYAVDPHKVFCQ